MIASARKIDEKNGNNYWIKAINKEMTNVGIDFTVLDDGINPPPGWRKASDHLVFDVKMDFTRKDRWVKDCEGNTNVGHFFIDHFHPIVISILLNQSFSLMQSKW